MGFLTASVKNGEKRSSLSYKIILEQREEKINSIIERNNLSVLVHFGNKNAKA